MGMERIKDEPFLEVKADRPTGNSSGLSATLPLQD